LHWTFILLGALLGSTFFAQLGSTLQPWGHTVTLRQRLQPLSFSNRVSRAILGGLGGAFYGGCFYFLNTLVVSVLRKTVFPIFTLYIFGTYLTLASGQLTGMLWFWSVLGFLSMGLAMYGAGIGSINGAIAGALPELK
jgi:hypothetical protein